MAQANTPQPPYYAAIFSSTHTGAHEDYDDDNLSIAVSYWESDETIRAFKELAEHLVIQKRGRETYYKSYKVRVAKVERDYGFNV